jgi:hypothetical protein
MRDPAKSSASEDLIGRDHGEVITYKNHSGRTSQISKERSRQSRFPCSLADRQSDTIGAASNTRDQDDPPVWELLRRDPDCLAWDGNKLSADVADESDPTVVKDREKSARIDSRHPSPTVGANYRGSYDTYAMKGTSRR